MSFCSSNLQFFYATGLFLYLLKCFHEVQIKNSDIKWVKYEVYSDILIPKSFRKASYKASGKKASKVSNLKLLTLTFEFVDSIRQIFI